MKQLTQQQAKVYDFIEAHPGCTTHDIQFATWVSCPSARITEMRALGVPIVSVGQKKYEGARAFEKYAIKRPEPEQLGLV